MLEDYKFLSRSKVIESGCTEVSWKKAGQAVHGRLQRCVGILKNILLVFPSLASVPLFLILYNNCDCGRFILVFLILLNSAAVAASSRIFALPKAASMSRFASSCLISAFFAVLLIEILFPFVLPKEHSDVLDLSKNFTNPLFNGSTGDAIFFKNVEQRLAAPCLQGNWANEQFQLWHAPGKPFVYYGWDPNSKSKYVNMFRWNSQGYFDHDYEPRKAPGVHRIVIIGDSYVESVQVPLVGIFHKRLETHLNSSTKRGPWKKFEVIALGNSGTGQVEHHKVLGEAATVYDPDTVLLTLCSNDFCDDDPELKAQPITRTDLSPRFRRLVIHGYYALAFACKRFGEILANRVSISPELLQWAKEDIPRIEAAWARTLGKILESSELCRSRGITFMLVYLGSDIEVKYAIDPKGTIARLKAMGGPHEQISWAMDKSLRRVEIFCREHDIVLISLLESLVDAQKETGNYVFSDHYTMFGHQVVAYTLSSALDARLWPNFAQNQDLMKHPVSAGHWHPVATPVTLDATREAHFYEKSRH